MAVCDICDKKMKGIPASKTLRIGDSLPSGWMVATNRDIENCKNLVKRALKVHIDKLGVSIQITDEMIQGWIKEKITTYGNTPWLLCPKCAGILKQKLWQFWK